MISALACMQVKITTTHGKLVELNDFKTLHCVKIEEATEDTTSLYLESDEPQVAPVTLKMFNFTEKIKNKKQ